MYPFKNPPAPTNRIWAACYMDSVTECFEIRTEAKTPGDIFTLYHKEYPIGTDGVSVRRRKGVSGASGEYQNMP